MAAENSTETGKLPKRLEAFKFKPGESGNPGGRPKKLAVTEYIKEQLERPIPEAMRAKLPALFVELYGSQATFGEMLAFKMVQMSAKGDMFAMKELLERVEGKVTQKSELTGKDGESLAFTLLRVDKE